MKLAQKKHYRPNLNEIAYDEIKQMILDGTLAQGERIFLDKMSEELNLSITPVREALNKLAQEDLVHITPRISYEVIQMSKEDICHILDIRELLETFALKTAGNGIKKIPVNKLRKLFNKEYPPDRYLEFINADVLLHESIISSTKNQSLKKLFDIIYNKVLIILVPSAKIEGRVEESNKEHLAILDSISEGNVEKAIELLSQHLQKIKKLLIESIDTNETK